MANEQLDPLALRFPTPHPNCTCAICTRVLWSDPQRSARDNIPSVFQRHKLVRQAAYLPPPQPGATPAPLPKRIPIYDYDMLDSDYTQFAAQYPQQALHILPPSSQQQPWIKAALKLTRQLTKLKAALPFLTPVDPVALQLPDYWDVVKHPMDLATVERKLAEEPSAYTEPIQWESDMRQIFHNANLCQPQDTHTDTQCSTAPHTAAHSRTVLCKLTLLGCLLLCGLCRQQAGSLCIDSCTRLFDQV